MEMEHSMQLGSNASDDPAEPAAKKSRDVPDVCLLLRSGTLIIC